MSDCWIVDAVRTPVGRYGGGLASVRPDDLASIPLRALVERTALDPAAVDEVILGCANQAGEDNRNVARMALLLADFPDSVPGYTVNRLCASGLEAIIAGSRMIRCGDADLVVAGGVESMTRAPWSMPRWQEGPPRGNRTAWDTSLGWRYPNPRLAARFPLEAMGETAENLVERHGITREAQDAFALESHRRALAAWEEGAFAAEICPVVTRDRKGREGRVERDESPRADSSMERLARLRPVFREGGTVTAGNSSPLNDGAAAVLLASDAGLARLGRPDPLARVRAAAAAGVDPRVMGIGPVPATRKACERAGVSSTDFASIELNEAFAAQSLAVIDELGLDRRAVNPLGGAIALGHPLGGSGARILTTLAHTLRRRGGGLGLATLCVGVGQGVAAIIEAA